ncbi:MAG: ABC transporter substrate-binding protein [Pseudomonadota bacterium]
MTHLGTRLLFGGSARSSIWILFLAGFCSSCGNSSTEIPERAFTVAFDGAPRNIDPLGASSVYSVGVVLATYETLFEYAYLKDSLDIKPGLANGMPTISDDGLQLTVTIREDSIFADSEIFADGRGRSVAARDVAFSLLRHFDESLPGQGAWLWRDLIEGIREWDGNYDRPPSGIEIVDERTIKFTLTEKSPQFLHTLTTGYSAVVPTEIGETDQKKIQYQSYGSGPFKVSQFDSARVELVRNENYPNRKFDLSDSGYIAGRHDPRLEKLNGISLPIPDRVTIEFIEDPSSRWISFDNSELDSMVIASDFLDPMLEKGEDATLSSNFRSRFKLNRYLANEVVLLRFNMLDPILGLSNDPVEQNYRRRLRCAIARGVDWEKRNKVFYGGEALLFDGLMPPTLPEFDANTRFDQQDRRLQSRALFKELSKERPLPRLTFGHTTSRIQVQNFDLFRSNLMNLGYPESQIVGVRYASFGDVLRGAHDGNHQITQSSWTLDYGDAENVLQLFYGPNRSPGANISNYDNSDYNELFERVKVLRPSEIRTELISEMQTLLADDCPYSGSATRERVVISQSRIIGNPNHDATKIGRYFMYIGFE